MLTHELIKSVSIDWVGTTPQSVLSVSIDSRTTSQETMFIPIVGDKFDGHDFFDQVVKRGTRVLFWQSDHPIPDMSHTDLSLYIVEDTLTALQQLAKVYLQTLQAKVIGITGSNGKTSTKDLVGAVLNQGGKTHITKGNYNNHIGLPLTILSAPSDSDFLVLEMGMSDFGEIHQLSQLATPDMAIVTNIGESHIEFLKTRKGISQAKLEILSGLKNQGLFIYDGDEPLLDQPYTFTSQKVSFSQEDKNRISVEAITLTQTTFKDHRTGRRFTIPMVGKHHAKNAMYAVLVGRYLGISDDSIQQGFDSLEKTGMRFEQEIFGEHLLVNDAYNASPTSMKGAITLMKSLVDSRQKILVLGDMFELGENSQQYHEDVGKDITPPIDYLVTIGTEAAHISKTAAVKKQHFQTNEGAMEFFQTIQQPSVILFKASRGMQFEQIIEQLKKLDQ